MQERRNSSALAMELRLSCTNPQIFSYDISDPSLFRRGLSLIQRNINFEDDIFHNFTYMMLTNKYSWTDVSYEFWMRLSCLWLTQWTRRMLLYVFLVSVVGQYIFWYPWVSKIKNHFDFIQILEHPRWVPSINVSFHQYQNRLDAYEIIISQSWWGFLYRQDDIFIQK